MSGRKIRERKRAGGIRNRIKGQSVNRSKVRVLLGRSKRET